MASRFDQISWVCDVQSSITMGGSGGGGGAPANTTANNTNTVINDVPAWEQQYMTNLLGQATTEAAQPYQQFPGQQIAGFTPDQTQAFSNIENQMASGQAANAGAAAMGQSATGAGTANSIYGAGSPWLQASAMYNPAAAAQPFMNAAANTNTPQGISAYMSPYLNNQIAGLQTLAQQNWNQFTAPGVNNSFISAGQSGSGRNEEVLGQQANLANQALTAQIANADQNAYTTAGQQAGAAASTLGNLANTAGSTAQAEAANLQGIGTGLGNLAATQAGAQGNAATNLAGTANTVQNTGITGASALQAVGQQQQNLAQQNINTAMSNFNAQNMWPEQQTSFLSDILRGLPTAGGASTSAGQTPTTTNMIGSTSPLGSLAGSLIGAGAVAGTGGIATGHARGGLIKGYADGGLSTLTSGGNDNAPLPSTPIPDQSSPLPQAPPDTSGQFNPAPDLSKMDSQMLNALPKTSNPPPTEESQVDSSLNTDREKSVQPTVKDNTISSNISGAHDNVSGEQKPSINSGSLSDMMRQSGMPQIDQNKMMQYQLLAMAKGMLTPAHSGAEALGNAFGNYGQAGMDMTKFQNEQQQRAAQLWSMNNWHQGNVQNAANRNDTYAQRVGDQRDIAQQRADTAQQAVDQKTGLTPFQQAQIKNMEAERQKPIPDGMGGFMIPNPTDPTNPQRIASPYAAPPAKNNADGTSLSGDAYLATVNPQVASMAKQIGDNTIQVTPYMMTKGDPVTKSAIAAAKIYNPDWSEMSYGQIQKFNTDPNGGVKVKGINTVVPHMQMLSDLTDAMKTGDVTMINSIKNKLATDFGVTFDNGLSDADNLKTASQLVGNEIVNSTIATKGGALGDREEVAKNISNAKNPEILKSNLQNVYLPAIRAQTNATEKYYQTNTGQKDFKRNRLLPETVAALYGQKNQQAAPQQAAAVPPAAQRQIGQTYQTPKGAMTWQGNGWLPAKAGAQ